MAGHHTNGQSTPDPPVVSMRTVIAYALRFPLLILDWAGVPAYAAGTAAADVPLEHRAKNEGTFLRRAVLVVLVWFPIAAFLVYLESVAWNRGDKWAQPDSPWLTQRRPSEGGLSEVEWLEGLGLKAPPAIQKPFFRGVFVSFARACGYDDYLAFYRHAWANSGPFLRYLLYDPEPFWLYLIMHPLILMVLVRLVDMIRLMGRECRAEASGLEWRLPSASRAWLGVDLLCICLIPGVFASISLGNVNLPWPQRLMYIVTLVPSLWGGPLVLSRLAWMTFHYKSAGKRQAADQRKVKAAILRRVYLFFALTWVVVVALVWQTLDTRPRGIALFWAGVIVAVPLLLAVTALVVTDKIPSKMMRHELPYVLVTFFAAGVPTGCTFVFQMLGL
jgi:hypothetical protein